MPVKPKSAAARQPTVASRADSGSTRSRGSIMLWVVVYLAGLTALYYGAINYQLPKTQARVATELHGVMANTGVRNPLVAMDGLNATLSGEIDSEEALRTLKQRLEGLDGIRALTNRIAVGQSMSDADQKKPASSSQVNADKPVSRPVTEVAQHAATRPTSTIRTAAQIQPEGAAATMTSASAGTAAPSSSTGNEADKRPAALADKRTVGGDNAVEKPVVSTVAPQTNDSSADNVATIQKPEQVVATTKSAAPAAKPVEAIEQASEHAPASALAAINASTSLSEVPQTRKSAKTPVQPDDATDLLAEAMNQIDTSLITFEAGSTRLTPASQEVLTDIAAVLAKHPSRGINILGHTDNQGAESVNQRISEARANAVRDYLAKRGIEPVRLFTYGYGDTAPIASNDTEAGRKQNRRIEFQY